MLGLALLPTACAGRGRPGVAPGPALEGGRFISCVPYARSRSGLRLAGDAWEWWAAAEGRHPRGTTPRAGSVLVFLRTSRLPQGHLSVVARIVSARELRVDHANWASGAARGRVALDQPVLDVSAAGDWSLVRVWHPPSAALGAGSWPTYGFVHAA